MRIEQQLTSLQCCKLPQKPHLVYMYEKIQCKNNARIALIWTSFFRSIASNVVDHALLGKFYLTLL